MRFFCGIQDYQGRGKIFSKKNFYLSSNRVKHCCGKTFSTNMDGGRTSAWEKDRKKINPVSEAGKHHSCCDWLKRWHMAAASMEKYSKDETARSGITSKNMNFLSLTKDGG